MYCTKCGSEVPDGNQFCVACGAAMAAPGPAAQTAPPPIQATPATPPAKRRGRTLVIALFTILVTLALGVGVGYWLWSSPPSVDPGSIETVIVSPAE